MRLLTLARDLRRRKARERQQLFVAEGVRAVEELLRSPVDVLGVLTAPQLAEAPRGAELAQLLASRRVETQALSPLEFGSAAETESPQGVIAIARIPERGFDAVPADWKGVVLVLDAVQDPGNVGTILRTAAALGVVATVSLPGTVDLWNAKVVRSGMGAHFRHLAFSTTWSELDAFRDRTRLSVVAADASGVPVDSVPRPERMALVVGNEGAGVSGEARTRAGSVISLPLQGDVESLNVAVATGILLYQFRQ